MANTNPYYNPAYSTVKSINLGSLDIIQFNTVCQFERLELVENVNDVFPNGVLILRDKNDVVSYINKNSISEITMTFFNGNTWTMDVTAVSYLNNAASDTEENLIGIYLSNLYYKKLQKTSLNKTLALKQPNVFLINEFVDELKTKVFDGAGGISDITTNYVLYRPSNTIEDRQEAISDNAIEYLNYLSSGAVGLPENSNSIGYPQFMFWTEFDGSVNFKYFYRNPEDDPLSANPVMIGVYNGDSVIQMLSDGGIYRKSYYMGSNPAYQFISKNYYYIKKTPKHLEKPPAGLSGSTLANYTTSTLVYQFQEEGQKYNIEVVDNENSGQAVPGAQQLFYEQHWGYYDGLDSVNDSSYHTLLGQNFGTETSFATCNLMGSTGYMPFVDTTEMWKNMFDMTEIHPNYPDDSNFIDLTPGLSTNLQKVMNIRYKSFLQNIQNIDEKNKKLKEIELQNFIMYSLCCMGKKDEDCFFAALTKYEIDSGFTLSSQIPLSGKKYRYEWVKLNFDGLSGVGGICGPSGGSGFYKIENWNFDTLRSSTGQDDTWSINLNERGLSADYLPPGWVTTCPISGFNYRPIGSKKEDLTGITSEDIFHIVKLCKYTEGENNFYYFTAENVVDGCCDTTGA